MTDRDLTARAQELLQESMRQRLSVIEDASAKARIHAELQKQAAQAELDLQAAWQEALNAGWEERELKQLGLTKPGTRLRRPRAGRGRAPHHSTNKQSAPKEHPKPEQHHADQE